MNRRQAKILEVKAVHQKILDEQRQTDIRRKLDTIKIASVKLSNQRLDVLRQIDRASREVGRLSDEALARYKELLKDKGDSSLQSAYNGAKHQYNEALSNYQNLLSLEKQIRHKQFYLMNTENNLRNELGR